MKTTILWLLCCFGALSSHAQNQEQVIRNYLSAYEKKDWNSVEKQLAPGFNFTSPAGDDHINLTTYHERCWGTSKFVKKVTFSKVMVQGNTAFATYDITTTDGKTVHNTEYYTFHDGKIQSIECFFGAGIGYPGNHK